MRRIALLFLILLVIAVPGASRGQDGSEQPTDSGVQERVRVSLVQVDTLVMNGKGETVPDLTKEDFELRIGNQQLEVATLDIDCPDGVMPDPLPLKKDQPLPAPIAPDVKRKIVFAFDYYNLDVTMRPQVLEAAEAMLHFAKGNNEEVMIAALGYGVRIEQRFTTDQQQLSQALHRMEHDVTLWAQEYATGANGEGYFKDVITLLDVLEGYSGPKALVYFSQLKALNVTMVNTWYNEVAMHAAASRTAIYPSNPDLLLSSGVSGTLSKFANQSGGRMPFFTGDVSVPYRWAQRDMSCRYSVGAYLDNEEGRSRKAIHLSVKREGVQLRHPEMLKLFTDEEKRASRARAAFVDPQSFENPLIRAFAFPVHPVTTKTWDTLLAVHFPMPIYDETEVITLEAAIRRDGRRVDKYKTQITIEPPEDGGDTRPVTLFGDSNLKDGIHDLTVVLSRPGEAEVVSAEAQFVVPPVLTDLLILRGPVLARVVPGGMLIRADPKDAPNDTRVDDIIGDDNSFEPLLVHEIQADEELLSYWNACVLGKLDLKGSAVAKRSFSNEDGEVIHEFEPIPFELETQVKKVSCMTELEKIPANTLEPGEYEYDVTIAYTNGDVISHNRVPLLVH